jgi:hypothetical protein
MELLIAEQFTDRRGQSQLYVAREEIFPDPVAWPLPHDAPYQEDINRNMMAIVEVSDDVSLYNGYYITCVK